MKLDRMKLNRVVRSGWVLSLAIAMAACGGDKESTGGSKAASDPGAPLAFVPADTPFVYANLDRIPRSVSESWMSILEPLQAGLNETLTRARAAAASRNDPDADKMVAFLELIADKTSLEGLEKIGFDATALFAFYGVGMQPVMRITLSDPERFRGFVTELEGLIGTPAPTAEVDGHSYWRFEPDGKSDFAIVAAIIDQQLVATLDIEGGESLQALLGLTRPAQSMSDGAALRAVNEQYGYLDYGTLLFDSRRLLDAVIGADENASTPMTRLFAENGQAPISAACRSEFQAIAAQTPRLVAGYTTLNEREQVANGVLETESALTSSLKALTAPVAGIGSSREGIEFGFSMRLDKLAEFIQAKASAIRANPYTCEYLVQLNEGAEEIGGQMAGLYMAASWFTGARFLVTDIQFDAKGKPSSVDAAMVVSAPNPASLIAMVKGFVPQLASLDLVPGAAPIAIDMTEYGVPAEQALPAFAAITDSSIGMSFGAGSDSRLSGYLGEPVSEPAPLLHFGYVGSFYGKIMREVERLTGNSITPASVPEFPDGEALGEDGIEADAVTGDLAADGADAGQEAPSNIHDAQYVMEPLMTSLSQVYDKLGFVGGSLYATDRGLEMNSTTTRN